MCLAVNLFPHDLQLNERSRVVHMPGFVDASKADALYQDIDRQVSFCRPSVTFYSQLSPLPREVAWITEDGSLYSYSGVSTEPTMWPEFLVPVRRLVEAEASTSFNSVLINRYRDGKDTVGWHSDDELELGPVPTIASLSLGASRRFLMRCRTTRQKYEFHLAHGDLLMMFGHCQIDYEHHVPRERRVVDARINLTFRNIFSLGKKL